MVRYQAKQPDSKGFIDYTEVENQTWSSLITRQKGTIENRACQEFIAGVESLCLSEDGVPQLPHVNEALSVTGWRTEPVLGTIHENTFFQLLSERRFPVATFIRVPEEIDYLQQPDIFHELFGHCPLLLHRPYADFVAWFGAFAGTFSSKDKVVLCRLFWFTIEFGLMKTAEGLRIYGGGILSSHQETRSSLNPEHAEHRPLSIKAALETDYDYTKIQPLYYILEGWDDLYALMDKEDDIRSLVSHIEGGGHCFEIC